MIRVVVRAVLPDPVPQDVGLIDHIADRWPGSMGNLANMGVHDGTLVVTEDWRLLFEFPSGTQLLWHENTRQWETIWGSVKKP